MASWAAIAKAAPPPAAPAAPVVESQPGLRMAVVDANAIISGVRMEGLADRLVTIEEVLSEVRDKQSRQFLATFPFPIETKEPTPESVAAVIKFAKETGDAHALSAVDIKLLALAHSLEVAAHGDAHLRRQPVQPKLKSRKSSGLRKMPGWDYVKDRTGWDALDAIPENQMSSAGATSRIIQHVQALDGSDAGDGHLERPAQQAGDGGVGTSTAAGVPSLASLASAAAAQQQARSPGSVSAGSAGGAGSQAPPTDDWDEGDASGSDGGKEDEWQTASSSRNAARRRARKDRRHEAWLQRQQQEEGAAKQVQRAPVPPQPLPVVDSAAQAAGGAGRAAGSGGGQDHDGARGDEDKQESGEEESGDEEEEDDDEESDGEGGDSGEEEEETEDGGELVALNTTSSVACVTADFAMQNVLLQLGLRLVTRDGQQITRLSRWVLRCSGCFFVTKEAGRLFCPRCGHMTVERVEVSVGPDGAEYYGIRKKHVLRGTRFALPKPKGGRNGKSLILSEDVLMQKMPRRRPKKADDEDGAFAPEFNQDTWFQAGQLASGGKGAKLLLTSWKNNPNERANGRTNRRK